MGTATKSTRVVTYESFFLSPLIAPHATIAADTPQMETAEAKITPNSSSTFNRRHIHMAKTHTAATTNTDCSIPGMPALTISVNKMVVPKMINPVLIKNSERAASFIQDGR